MLDICYVIKVFIVINWILVWFCDGLFCWEKCWIFFLIDSFLFFIVFVLIEKIKYDFI